MNESALNPNAIAIVGMACRFPGAGNPEQFWANLARGIESIRRFSRDELLAAGFSESLIDQPQFVSAHGALDDIAGFDAEFFGYTAAEAALIDPQHRILLECAYAALEDAGIDPSRITPRNNLTGIFAGCGLPAYLVQQVHPTLDTEDPGAVYQAMLGNDKDFLAARIAYKLNLGGPAVTLQAACATALVCVHAACQSLLNGECDTALAGGVSLRIPQAAGYLHQQGGIHSADGHCRAFDARADGTVSGSGAGMVVLQRLADALAADHPIHAVILGSAVNNDGGGKMSFTAPAVDGQAAVIAEAHAVAGVAPASIAYIETHGTGTALGDPIEIAALTQAFGRAPRESACLIGSVKTNIGHLDAAAGIAGLIKTVLSLRQAAIPPSLNFERGNPNIDFAAGSFQVCTALTPWPASGSPRRAGVSSFGLGGSNAHVVLEEAPLRQVRPASAVRWRLCPLSARSPALRQARIARLADHLRAHPNDDLSDLAWTLSEGRPALPEAAFVVTDSSAGLARALREGAVEMSNRPQRAPRIAFLYPGQGSQQAGSARLLYADEPVFRAALDGCAEALLTSGLVDVRDFLLASSSPELDERVRETIHAQPVIFALSYALTALWRHRGIVPDAVLGHSSGEYAAAVAAGILTLEAAARALSFRARLMSAMPAGGMTAVGLAENELRPLLPSGLSIAAISGPALCTVAGELELLAGFEAVLAPRGILLRRLQTAHAFHTPAVDAVLPHFRTELKDVPFTSPGLSFYSAVLGRQASRVEAMDREMWVSQIRQPVCFAPALEAMLADGYTAFVEIGSGSTLTTLARLSPNAENAVLISGLSRTDDPRRDLLTGLGQLWLAGVTIPWSNLFAGDRPRRLSLPTYPFSATPHWVETRPTRQPGKVDASGAIRLLLPGWRRAAPVRTVTNAVLKVRWLVFADAGDAVGELLIERLRLSGATVAIVRPALGFSQHDEEWTIAASSDADYRRLLDAVRPQRIVHAWHFSNATGESPCPPCLDSFFRLLRAVAIDASDLREIAVLSHSALDVTGNETLNPAQATLLGPVRGLPLEFPDVRSRLIDVAEDGDVVRLAAAIAAELSETAPETVVALRGPHRWLPDMLPVQAQTVTVSPVRSGGIYLITGGLGGLGLAVAGHLARQGRVRLALLGRTVLPPECEWDDWPTGQPEGDRTRGIIAGIMAVRALGSEVLVLSADIADPDQAARAISVLRSRWGEPNGIIHAAGTAGGGAIARRSDDDLAAVLRPKITGTDVLLASIGGDARPDFVVFFSTVNTVWPVPGQMDYAAANTYLDATAAQLRRRGIRATAVNWDAWRSVGMAAHSVVPEVLREARREELERFGLSTDDAGRALIDILAGDYGQVIVTTAGRLRALSEPPVPVEDAPAQPEDKSGPVIDGLAEIWRGLLGIAEVAPEDDFFQRGGHSLLATRVGFRVRQRWGCLLSLNDIFAHPTLAAMAGLIESRMAAEADRESFLF